MVERQKRTETAARRQGEFFRELSRDTLNDFEALEHTAVYAANTVLFAEKDISSGVFVLRRGRIKLSISSRDGKKLVLRIANAGDLLNVTGAISGSHYEMTAETLHNCEIAFIPREDFLRFLLEHPDAYQSLARELSLNYHKACEKLRTVVLSSSVTERLARLLLEWGSTGKATGRGSRVTISMTHGEIGEFIGTSRETVTRTLSEFKLRKLAVIRGATLMISNRVALENVAGF
jgi:CRP/FNR family transcriptional regulator